MGKGRVRVKGAKGKRWRKGQSGSSNPSETRHRQAAKGRFGDHLSRGRVPSSGPPLTADTLATHDASQEEGFTLDRDGDVELREEGEEGSHSTHTSTSAASSSAYTLIETAHPVFGSVRKLWNSPTESHRVICAVLAAVSEVVKTHEGKDSETEYFGALMTALESAEEERSVAAICYLLSLIMPSVPREVLQLRYNTVCKTLMDQLSRRQTSNSTALLKSLVRVLTLLLEVQAPSVWADSYTQKMYQMILNFTVHPKPRLRKAAQGGVVSMLRDGTSTGDFHPAAPLTAKHCKHVIQQGGVETATLHTLVMMKDCLANFPTPQLKSLCELILKSMTLGSRMVRTTCLHALHGLLSSLAGPQGLTAELAAKLISALYDHQPNVVDSQLLCAWLTVMESAHIKLASLDQELCMAHLVRFFSTSVSCLLSSKTTVTETAASATQALLEEVVRSYVQSVDATVSVEASPNLQLVQKAYLAISKGLHYKYQHSWGLALKTIAVFHQVAGEKCHAVMSKTLPSLCTLHSTPDFPFVTELEEAVAVAIETMGPQVVLQHVPLQLDSESDPPSFSRSWLLPVLRDHISRAQLSYFTESLLPLAGRMRARAEGHHKAGKKLEAKLYDTLQYQIWSLLPGFCREPTDVQVSFPSLARILGTALSDRDDLRTVVATSLRQLVESSRESAQDKQVLARFSKNYLPILFNLYTTSTVQTEWAPLLECVRAYASITEEALVVRLFRKMVEKLQQEDLARETRCRLLDLVQALVPQLPDVSLKELLDAISPLLDSTDATMQKKAYRSLEQLLASESHTRRAFVQKHLKILTSALSESLSTSSSASKKPRLKCLVHLVEHIGADSADFIATITPEVILCTKEVNEKCRSLSFQLLVNIGYTVQRCYGLNAEESVTKYLTCVLAGLAGSTHMVSATIIALSRLVYEFHDVLSSDMTSRLVSTMCTLLSSHTREIVKAAFGFIKIIIGVLPPSELSPHLEKLIGGVLRWSEDPRSHFRLKARFILERLIRKFSYEVVSGMVPRKHQKLMVHIRKLTEREKRRKLSTKEDREQLPPDMTSPKRRQLSYEDLLCDSSEEEEEHGRRRGKAVGRRTAPRKGRGKPADKGGSWIREASGEEPLNFLDSSVARNVITTKPPRQRGHLSNPFQTTAEGKLVIGEDKKEEEGEVAKMSVEEMETESSEVVRRKRKRTWKPEEDEEEEEGGRRGKGIYRKNPDFDYGSEYRAKKARGDVKLRGKPDPYVYVPLLGQKLNKRKRAKLSGQFRGVLRKAKRGSASGTKWRKR